MHFLQLEPGSYNMTDAKFEKTAKKCLNASGAVEGKTSFIYDCYLKLI